MRYSKDMIEGKEYTSRNWNDTCANFYTRTGDMVTCETVYRHGKAPAPFTQTCASYDAWVDECKQSNYEGIAV